MRKSGGKSTVKPHVFHPVNTAGTTWLKESDLVFINDEPYAVLSWHGGQADSYVPLNRKHLKHDHDSETIYRYDVELPDPADLQRLNKLS